MDSTTWAQITVYTSDIRGAGTDSDVFITVYGPNGDTGERLLDNSTNKYVATPAPPCLDAAHAGHLHCALRSALPALLWAFVGVFLQL